MRTARSIKDLARQFISILTNLGHIIMRTQQRKSIHELKRKKMKLAMKDDEKKETY